MAAIGARGMRQEPRVNAPHVETVVAFRQHSNLVPFLELAEAYGALRRRNSVFASGGAVHRHRDAAELAALQPGPRQPCSRLLRRLVAEAPPAPQRAPRDGVQAQRAYQSAQQRRQNDHHVCVEVRVADERVARVVSAAAAVRRWHAQLRLQKPPL